MIDWKLAEKLKNAGFPQKYKEGDWFYRCGKICEDQHFIGELEYADDGGADTYEATEDSVKIPTLEELIEACGERFHQLRRQSNLGKVWWKAESWEKELGDSQYEDDQYINRKANTPEEAVSLLWLEINKK